MDQEIKKNLTDRELLEKIYESAEKTRKYFLWVIIASVVLFVVPLVIFLVVLPGFLGNITGTLSQ